MIEIILTMTYFSTDWDWAHPACVRIDNSKSKRISCMIQIITLTDEAEDSNLTREVESEITCYPECEHYDYPLEVALGNLAKSAYVNGLLFLWVNGINVLSRREFIDKRSQTLDLCVLTENSVLYLLKRHESMSRNRPRHSFVLS